jgi:signal transduction histidine kinase
LDVFEHINQISAGADSQAQALKEVTALYNVGVVLNSTLNSKEVVWAVYKECGRLVDTTNFALAMVEPKRDNLQFVLVFKQGQSLKPFAAPIEHPPALTAAVLTTETPLLVSDASQSTQKFELGRVVPNLKVGSWLGVPIVNPSGLAHNPAQGVIVVWSSEPNAFNRHHQWLLSAIGVQASIAIRNARLYENSQRKAAEMARLKDMAQRQAEDMTFLNEVGRTLASSLHLDQVLSSIMAQVDEMLQAEAASLMLTDPATGDLVFQLALGDKSNEVKPFRVPKGKGIAGQVAETGKPLVIADVAKDTRHFKGVDEKTQFITRNILCVPLILHEQVVGVVQVLNKKAGEFTQRDIDLMTSIASYAAIAIENARLYETLEAEHNRSIAAEQETRKRLASDLHDGPTQLVAAIMMNLDFATKALQKDPSLLPQTIVEMQTLAARASHQMRTLLFELRPLVLETQGLGAALQVFLDRRQQDIGQNKKPLLKLKIQTDNPGGDIARQDGKIEATLFAIVQETVNNAIKHAKADTITVALEETPAGIYTVIADDGDGFDVEKVLKNYETRGSLGMINIRERAESIGGKFSIESEPGAGPRITIYLPTEDDEKTRQFKRTLITGALSIPAHLTSK